MSGAIRVLVVDDHQMFVDSLVRLLEHEAGIDVVGVAGSGQGALAALSPARPHVVVLDYQLPDGSGAGAAMAMLREDPSVKVVMLTGHADASAARAAVESGCAAFVTKDKAARELVDVVRAAFEGRAQPPTPELVGLGGGSASTLSSREREVLALLADGLATDAIADRLFISRNTVRAHVQRVITKLGAHSKLEAVAIARRNGLA
jgi:DNA-binding NarL/FixJ family response regulator